MNFKDYDPGHFYDEIFEGPGRARPGVESLVDLLHNLEKGDLQRRQRAAETILLNLGITFNVYGAEQGVEKIFPFDIIPRTISAKDWDYIERGVKQRIFALNEFIKDIYSDQKILKDGVVPKDLVLSSEPYRKECIGLRPPKGIWAHITGTDLVRDRDGQFYVLEDNLRCPSGVSYVLGNRQVLKQTFPGIFSAMRVRPVDAYPNLLLQVMDHLVPESVRDPCRVILTPGVHNSAYFEHSFLARQMGIELVQGSDLVVSDDFVYMKTTRGFQRVDAIYRRIDDDFLDPKVFRSDSLLGCPGLMEAYMKGHVALINAPGTGVADDKAVYNYVPQIIRYYMNEDCILPNVPTYLAENPVERSHIIDNLKNMVVKETNASGGYGMLIGPASTYRERKLFEDKIKANPRNYIGQPVIQLSRAPILVKNRYEGRHVDLRPFVLYGEEIQVIPGGLTRVALKKNSLVVNSSQGGGSKDTWVLYDSENG
ncbi:MULTISPECIES: circularly permuted type 2 ATP-grasp protein [unclassified Nitrospina]|uniref:circularly permuted type 2 ATP-grasp protein n=1 Tax=unclassified Nitrospina TaxID=2638683 RepID=UPI003F9ADE5B